LDRHSSGGCVSGQATRPSKIDLTHRIAMSIYAIALLDPNDAVSQKISTNYQEHYEYSRTLFLVEAGGLAETVATTVGIKGDDRVQGVSGFVVKLEGFSYSGYTSRSLWEWLREVEKRR
jgi:hypothetical protein